MKVPRVTVVIPAYQEASLIARTIAGIPAEVDEIIVVDDASFDETGAAALASGDLRVQLLRHEENRGVGAAIYSGYRQALLGSSDVFVVMAGDNQMDGSELPLLLAPIADKRADYVKGNRLMHSEVAQMPFLRRCGTRTLAWFTSLAAGVIFKDTQCGFTAISRQAAEGLTWDELWPRYGYPNDLLIHLVAQGRRVVETPVRPVYAEESSGLRPWHMLSILGVIARRFWIEKSRTRVAEKTAIGEKLILPGESAP